MLTCLFDLSLFRLYQKPLFASSLGCTAVVLLTILETSIESLGESEISGCSLEVLSTVLILFSFETGTPGS